MSYNRTSELERALESLASIQRSDVKVCIYEDCSPNQGVINDICKKHSNQLSIDVEFKPSHVNLGYDKNLLRALSADSEYVLLMSDDDFFEADFLEEFLVSLYENRPDVFISPYKASTLYRSGAHYSGNYSIDVLYDSILFSGLAFRVDALSLTKDEVTFLDRSIYVQVFLVCKHWSNNCGYFGKPLIIAGSDGENFFGKSEVSLDMETLKDRETLMSNVYYQVYLQRVAFECLGEFYPLLKSPFLENYSKRLVSHFIRVRLNGSTSDYIKSINEMRKIDVKFKLRYVFLILIVIFIPKFLLKPMFHFLIKKYRVSGG